MRANRRLEIDQGRAQVQPQFSDSGAVASEWDDGAQSKGGLGSAHGICVQHQLFQVWKTSRKRFDLVVRDLDRLDVANSECFQVAKV